MQLIFFTHPQFMKSQSMPRFASLLSDGMKTLGHNVEVWSPKPMFYQIPAPEFLKKWLGYIDQYLVFPITVRKRIKGLPEATLFVFTDQALGPWVPLVKKRPHVIHCHDFLAQRSALGEIKENPTKLSGKLYQKYIYQGYKQGRNFISVSRKTQQDLHRFVNVNKIDCSEVVYNGLNQDFHLQNGSACREAISARISRDVTQGYILHVGGNQWYKNRKGVIEIYEQWRTDYPSNKLPLLLVGANPSDTLKELFQKSIYKEDIIFVMDLTDTEVQMAYAGASVFLFPSLAEGFGWPIAEAMASGCPVITTGEAPMSEVSGEAGFLLPVQAHVGHEVWQHTSADILQTAVHKTTEEREEIIQKGLRQIKRFNTASMLAHIEQLYEGILSAQSK